MRKFPNIRYFSDYYHYIVGLIDKSGVVINRRTLTKSIKGHTASITYGEIRAPESSGYPDETALPFDERNGLIFRDGSFLRFSEHGVRVYQGKFFRINTNIRCFESGTSRESGRYSKCKKGRY